MKNFSKKYVTAGVMVVLLFVTTGISLAAPKKSRPVSLLFSLHFKPVYFKHLRGNMYQLKIPFKSAKKLLAFTDRPYRQAFMLSPKNYKMFTARKGKNSFRQDPPNLTLTLAKVGYMGIFSVQASERTKHMEILTLRYLPAKKVLQNKKSSAQLVDPSQLPLSEFPPKNYVGSAYLFVDESNACWKFYQGNYSSVGSGIDSFILDLLDLVGVGEIATAGLCKGT